MQLLLDFWSGAMSYTTWTYFVLCGIVFALYYLLPHRCQWVVLLAASALFYYFASGKDPAAVGLFAATIAFSYAAGRILENRKNKYLFALLLIVSIAPLLLVKGNVFVFRHLWKGGIKSLIVPLGLSFYSLQIYSYLFDVHAGKISPQKNALKYALYISFFPHIMQGPIPRYSQLGDQLFEEHGFDTDRIARGGLLVLWGFFLKYVIAERCGIVVNTVFDHPKMYLGSYVLVAGVLYSIQLYTDFLACVCMCRGMAAAFGIEMAENFLQPYRAGSVRDFWRRWHISLSLWLRDYVYIPLGGNKKGKVRKYLNLAATFFISGAWHGNGFRFLFWGLLHAFYQISGDLFRPAVGRVKRFLGIRENSFAERQIDRAVTFVLVMLAWIIFRADKLKIGLRMIASMFTVWNPWIFWDDSLLALGLDWREWMVLLFALGLLAVVERMQDRDRIPVRDRIMAQPLIVRWVFYFASLAFVILYGVYGFGFNAADFIYRGF